MKEAIFYEVDGGWLHKCMFAGLDINNKPQWLVMEPCTQVVTQEEYAFNLGVRTIDFNLLCEKGDTVSSTDIAKMMSACLDFNLKNLDWRFGLQLKTLKRLGVEWSQEPLDFHVRINSSAKNAYTLYIHTLDDVEKEDIVWKEGIKSFEEALAYGIAFLGSLSVLLEIRVRATLGIDEEDSSKLTDLDKALFNDVLIN